MVKRWRRYIKHPLFIGSILSLLVIFVLAKFLPFYIIDKIEDSTITNNGEVYFWDLDNDGNSEKLNYYHYDRIFQPTLYLYDSKNKLITLWNFLDSPVKNYKLFSGDINNDQLDEIFVFTQKLDSLFLCILVPNKDAKPVVEREFIAKIDNGNNLEISSVGLFNLDQQSTKEYVFFIDAGYPSSPRKIFVFNIDKKEVKTSPNFNADIKNPILVQDINSDDELEIILSNKSLDAVGTGNKTQLIVLDNNLNFLFQPTDFLGGSSQVSVKVIEKNNQNLLAVLRSGAGNETVFNDLMLYNSAGEKIQEINLQSAINLLLTPIEGGDNSLYLFNGKKILKYSSNLSKTETYNISKTENFAFFESLDLIGDEENEFLFISDKELLILSNNLRYKAKLDLNKPEKVIISKVIENQKIKAISVQSDDKWSLYEFYENKAFFYSSIFYLLIFITITFISFLLSKIRFSLSNFKRSVLKTNEEELLKEIEDNLKERFTDLKTQVDKIGKKTGEDSYEQILTKIDDTYEKVKTISTQIKTRSGNEGLKKELLNLTNKKRGTVKTNLHMFSDNEFASLNSDIKSFIIELCDKCIDYISGFITDHQLNIQIVEHADYINLLFEIEGLFIETENINQNQELNSTLKRANGKLELSKVSDYGTIINIILPCSIELENTAKTIEKTKVIIAEDHDVSLFGLMSLFKTKEDIEVVGTAKNGLEVLKLLETEDTDIVITDISMPGMDGIELAEKLKNEYPEIKVIVFTMYMENWFVEQLINHGAKAFVSKNSKTTELISAVRSVMEGNNYYCPQFKSKFGFKGTNNGIKQKLDSLSKNELHIVKQYAENFTKDQIATEMELSAKTMDNFIANILLKLNAGDEDEIIRIAKKQKFVSE